MTAKNIEAQADDSILDNVVIGSQARLDAEDQIEVLTNKFYVPDSAFIAVLIVLATVIPQAFGLNFARNGVVFEGHQMSAAVFFSKLDFTPYQFFLAGFIPTALFVLFFLLAILYTRVKWLKYAAIALFAVVQFIAGFAYTRLAFSNPTHVAYHAESFKVNAINVGVISVLFVGCLLLFLIIVSLILRKYSSFLQNIYKKSSLIITFLILAEIVQIAVAFFPLLKYFGAAL